MHIWVPLVLMMSSLFPWCRNKDEVNNVNPDGATEYYRTLVVDPRNEAAFDQIWDPMLASLLKNMLCRDSAQRLNIFILLLVSAHVWFRMMLVFPLTISLNIWSFSRENARKISSGASIWEQVDRLQLVIRLPPLTIACAHWCVVSLFLRSCMSFSTFDLHCLCARTYRIACSLHAESSITPQSIPTWTFRRGWFEFSVENSGSCNELRS